MRNISFALTTEQFLDGTKDVTRRLGWKFLKKGDRLMACEKCQGIKAGELKRLGVIEVVSVRRERLSVLCDSLPYGEEECRREGFPKMAGKDFVEMFCSHMNCGPHAEVTRIEFRRVRGIEPCPMGCCAGEVESLDGIHRRACPNCGPLPTPPEVIECPHHGPVCEEEAERSTSA